jgi:lysozyme
VAFIDHGEPTAVVPPCRNNWTLWQYTDRGVGPLPHSVNGIGHCDRDYFNGTAAQLKTWWGK